MQRVGVGVGVDGDGADAHPARGPGDAAGDLAAVGDQDLVEHRRPFPVGSSGRRRARRSRPPSTSLPTSRADERARPWGCSQIISSDQQRRATTSAAIGWAKASQSTVPTARSSPNDAAQLENGSGEVLITARLPVFARWLPAASEPPTIAAASAGRRRRVAEHAGRQRRTRRNADEGVHDVPQRVDAGDLVGEELDEEHEARRRQHPADARARARPPGSSIQLQEARGRRR